MAINFVKFQRGTQAAYNALKTANRVEEDALYFIYNNPADTSAGGKLYLGERLIGGTGSGDVVSQLNDLTDVDLSNLALLSNEEADGAILQYNNNTHKWEVSSIKDAIEASGADIGSSSSISISMATTQEGEEAEDVLDNIISPNEGNIVFVDGVPYIYDGSNWQLLIGTNLDDKINELESRIADLTSDLEAVDGKISAAVAQANHLQYMVPTDGQLPIITQDNVGSLSNTIFLISNGEQNGEDRYNEYMLINGAYEKLGSLSPNLSQYVTTETFETQVGALEDELDNLQAIISDFDLSSYVTYDDLGSMDDLRTATGNNNSTVIGELLDIRERFIWNPIEE